MITKVIQKLFKEQCISLY